MPTKPQTDPFRTPAAPRPADPVRALGKATEDEFVSAFIDYLDPASDIDTARRAVFRDARIIEKTFNAATQLSVLLGRQARLVLPGIHPADMDELRARLKTEKNELGPLVEEKRAEQRAMTAKRSAPKRALEVLGDLFPELRAEIQRRIEAGESPDEVKASMLRGRELPTLATPRPRRRRHQRRRRGRGAAGEGG